MKKFWDGYGWLIALAVFAIIILRAFWGREPFCGVKDEQCLREWLSALSGWVGGAAAIITILVISDHHRKNIELQNVPILRTAQLANESCFMLKSICLALENSLEIEGDVLTAQLIELNEIQAILTGEVVKNFELNIGSGDSSGLIEARAVTSAVQQFIAAVPPRDLNQRVARPYNRTVVNNSCTEVIAKVRAYAKALETSATAYILRFKNA